MQALKLEKRKVPCDSCTAIVEHMNARLELVRAWEPAAAVTIPSAVPPAPTSTCHKVGDPVSAGAKLDIVAAKRA